MTGSGVPLEQLSTYATSEGEMGIWFGHGDAHDLMLLELEPVRGSFIAIIVSSEGTRLADLAIVIQRLLLAGAVCMRFYGAQHDSAQELAERVALQLFGPRVDDATGRTRPMHASEARSVHDLVATSLLDDTPAEAFRDDWRGWVFIAVGGHPWSSLLRQALKEPAATIARR